MLIIIFRMWFAEPFYLNTFCYYFFVLKYFVGRCKFCKTFIQTRQNENVSFIEGGRHQTTTEKQHMVYIYIYIYMFIYLFIYLFMPRSAMLASEVFANTAKYNNTKQWTPDKTRNKWKPWYETGVEMGFGTFRSFSPCHVFNRTFIDTGKTTNIQLVI